MRIKQIFIKRYGPIENLDIRLKEGLQLIYGVNESGKTLAIDAVLKMLLSGKTKDFEKIDRVDEWPEGYIVLEDEDREIKLPSENDLCAYLSVDGKDLRNIFVIRDSDVRLRDGENYLRRVTDRLAQLELERVETIKTHLACYGRLTNATSAARLSNDLLSNKIANQRRQASSLIEEIEQYVENSESADLDKLESGLLHLRRNDGDLDSEIQLLEKANKNQRFQKLFSRLGQLKNLRSQQTEYRRRKDDAETLLQDIQFMERSKREAPGIQDVRLHKRLVYSLFVAFITATVFLGVLGKATILSTIVPLVSFSLFAYFLFKFISLRTAQHKVARQEETILQRGTIHWPQVNSVDSLQHEISAFLGEVERIENEIKSTTAVLEDNLGKCSDAMDENLVGWGEQIENLQRETALDLYIEFDEHKLEDLKEQLRGLREEQNQASQLLENHKRQLQYFQNEASRLVSLPVFLEDYEVTVNNLNQLRELQSALNQFIDKTDGDFNTAIEAIRIFEAIQAEEESKIAELFGEHSPISRIFEAITGGRYGEVRFNTVEGIIQAVKKDKKVLTVDKLSQSTYSQLYLAVRVFLAERLLGEGKGFFILDDPFLTADPARLSKQFRILQDLTERGWNILYFSCKGETKDIIGKHSANEAIFLKPLD